MNPLEKSLKARLNNYALANGIASQVALQDYMFQRFLIRLSRSRYKEHVLLKGGLLVANLVGWHYRSTLDMDVTLRHFPLSATTLRRAWEEIVAVPMDDGVRFAWVSSTPSRPDDPYGGLSIRFDATYGSIRVALSMDVTAGDAVAGSREYEIPGILEPESAFSLYGYSVETILAEKVETILRRGLLNTRTKDFYDVVALTRMHPVDRRDFLSALNATVEHRGTQSLLRSPATIIDNLERDRVMLARWQRYSAQYPYAADITFADCLSALRALLA